MTDHSSPKLASILRAAMAGDMPPGIALMQLAIEAATPNELIAALSAATGDDAASAGRLSALRSLHAAHPKAWHTVKSVLAEVSHEPGAGEAAERLRETAKMFDRASLVSPEASVALYSLGDPSRLAAATAEIADWLEASALLQGHTRVLDVGCGIGRIETAIAAQVQAVTGLDISDEMVGLARQRCAALSNVEIAHTTGLDLAVFENQSFELVLYVDCFPYLVSAGGDLAARHIGEAGRVLASGGDLVVLNYSYRGDLDTDRAELRALAPGHGLSLAVEGEQPFAHWDGAVFHLIKSSSR